jgi:hypothetical protein
MHIFLSYFLFIQELQNFEKTEKFFSQVIQMATHFKMTQNWFFDHNSVSFGLFFVGFKKASDIQDGGRKSREYNFEIGEHFV